MFFLQNKSSPVFLYPDLQLEENILREKDKSKMAKCMNSVLLILMIKELDEWRGIYCRCLESLCMK